MPLVRTLETDIGAYRRREERNTIASDNPTERAMADDTSIRSTEDRMRINVHQAHEIRYWTRELGCTIEELREAVVAVGPFAKHVREYVGKHRR